MKIRTVGAELFHAVGRTGVKKLRVAFVTFRTRLKLVLKKIWSLKMAYIKLKLVAQ